MANVHSVEITGKMPFNIYEHEPALRWLGMMNAPLWGLEINYPSKSPTFLPSRYGGQTAMYRFVISGSEAIWPSGIKQMVEDFQDGGAIIEVARCKDIEYPSRWYDII